MTFAIAFPNIDPVLVQFGPFMIRWYSLAYIAGLLLGWRYIRLLAKWPPERLHARDIDDFLVWATLGVILGGRLGYVLFYNSDYFLANPLAVIEIWKGGMSFHGGLLGMITATLIFCRRRRISLLVFGDLVAAAAPIGLFLGRLANFVNGELFGRVTDAPWGVVFPHGGPLPRHPSQIYEALLEGLLLFLLLLVLARFRNIRERPGVLTGVFLIGYGASRLVIEVFRQPDVQIGFLTWGSTMGQWLSAPMILAGLLLVFTAHPKPAESGIF
ncbi:prolipoprotein diacylglyceryl transferase [Shumkonia mesophila]|uniref:prolipoprotein diacylglyceryl transferase n=1 Tax=Shumkonia mesophila TaxID=2838854 RepID=UPI002934ECCD|nr:prolipoprotein diacylglyceryl transferase [Shumkonia mesophila]